MSALMPKSFMELGDSTGFLDDFVSPFNQENVMIWWNVLLLRWVFETPRDEPKQWFQCDFLFEIPEGNGNGS